MLDSPEIAAESKKEVDKEKAKNIGLLSTHGPGLVVMQ